MEARGLYRIGGVAGEEAGITGWLIEFALERNDDAELLDGFCDCLVAAGVPLLRVAVGSEAFHPTLDAMVGRWLRGCGVEREDVTHERAAAGEEEWRRSPFYQLVELVRGGGHNVGSAGNAFCPTLRSRGSATVI
jgi:hypothetical protein